jgi:thymidylate synthase
MNKIDQINQILNKLKPLNEKRLFLELQYNVDKSNFLRSGDDIIYSSLVKSENEIQLLQTQILPLQKQLRDLQTKYFVEYEGELINIHNNNSKYWNSYSEELFFKNECDINTFEHPISSINEKPNLEALLAEICDFIYYHRFTNYKILNIKKIN